MGFPLQVLRGTYSWLVRNEFLAAFGEPFLAAIVAPDGTSYTFLVWGGHDGQNKVQSCGETCLGEPAFQAPAGCEIYDTLNQYKWVSNGWSESVPADGLDQPFYGMITASNFLGWTAFCPCLAGLPPAPSSSLSGSSPPSGGGTGGGGDKVVVPHCPSGVAVTLYLSLSGFASCPCFNGNYVLSHMESLPGFGYDNFWASPLLDTSCGTTSGPSARWALYDSGSDASPTLVLLAQDQNGDWSIQAGGETAAFSCNPFEASGAFPANGNTSPWGCVTASLSVAWSVAD